MVSIDGTDISGATIDGTDVAEITVDGDTVWTASNQYLSYCENGTPAAYYNDLDSQSRLGKFTNTSSGIFSTAITQDYVAYGARDSNVYVRNISDNSLKYTISPTGFNSIPNLAMNENYLCVGCNDDNIYIYDLSDGSLTYTFTDVQGTAGAGPYVEVGNGFCIYTSNTDIQFRDLSTGNLVDEIQETDVESIAAAGDYWAYTNQSGDLAVREYVNGSINGVRYTSGNYENELDITDQYAVTMNSNDDLIVYDFRVNTGVVHQFAAPNFRGKIAVTNEYFTFADDATIWVYDMETGNQLYTLNSDSGFIRATDMAGGI